MRVNLRSVDAWALVLALAAGALLLLSGPGYRVGAWALPTAFSLIRWGAYAGAVASVAAAWVLWRSRGRSLAGVLALVVGVTAIAAPLRLQRQAASVPPIHDITTDTADPPTFETIVALRADARNTLEYSQEVAHQQRQAYPDIKPLILELPAPQVFERALRAARDSGWEIAASNADAGLIEATDTTPFFGFKDDIVVRLTALGDRTVVDVRSVSRVGRSDLGTNARRIRDYLERLSRG